MPVDSIIVNECNAEFTINSQHANVKVAVGTQLALQANDLTATDYEWAINCTPVGCDYELQGQNQAQATLLLKTVGAYVVQLTVTAGQHKDVSRLIAWAVTSNHEYCLPVTGEPLIFSGDAAWAGDLGRVITDTDTSLPTVEQKLAMDAAANPNGENPFATINDLSESQLTPEQKAAIENADNPSGTNPFVTKTILPIIPPPQLTPEQETAVDNANNPNGENPFATLNDLPEPQLTPEQETAVDHANNPNAENPFATMVDLPDIPVIPDPQLTPEQEMAVDYANNPNGENPFATMADLPVIPIIPEPQLTPEQETAVDNANNPNGENPFATLNDLPGAELSPEQKAAIENADNPSGTNPFVTKTILPIIPPPQLTPEQETAVDNANNPNGENPFATLNDLPEPQLTPEQETAVDHANNPNGENPFATIVDLPTVPEPQLTPPQKAAIDNAKSPSDSNPFVTHTEIEPLTRLVPRAAGCIALHSDIGHTVTLGNLRVTEIDTLNGRFTLTFDGYQKSRSPHYIVNALTVHDHPTTLNRIYNVEMVRFEQDGITFHMSRFPGGKAALAPNCMVEVREII